MTEYLRSGPPALCRPCISQFLVRSTWAHSCYHYPRDATFPKQYSCRTYACISERVVVNGTAHPFYKDIKVIGRKRLSRMSDVIPTFYHGEDTSPFVANQWSSPQGRKTFQKPRRIKHIQHWYVYFCLKNPKPRYERSNFIWNRIACYCYIIWSVSITRDYIFEHETSQPPFDRFHDFVRSVIGNDEPTSSVWSLSRPRANSGCTLCFVTGALWKV